MADTSDLKSADLNSHEGSTPSPRTYHRYDEVLWESGVSIIRREYQVIGDTPCGVWISLGGEIKKWVSLYTKKKYACPTPEEALVSFRARKKRQIGILKAKLEIAEAALVAEPDGSKSYFVL